MTEATRHRLRDVRVSLTVETNSAFYCKCAHRLENVEPSPRPLIVWVFRSTSRRPWTEASDRVTVSTNVASSCRGRGVITR
eukprot:scaffold109743_cov70-Phaeocystis_antarctica.AAC.1